MWNYTFVVENTTRIIDLGNKDARLYPETIVIINCVLNAPLLLISITGNALVLVAILKTPSLRSLSTVFLCSLAASDFLVGLVAQPGYISDQLKSGHALFFARRMLSLLTCGVSLFTMAAISMDRFLDLHYHIRYPNLMTERRPMYTSSTIWVNGIILSSLTLWNRSIYFWFAIAVNIPICLSICTYSYIRIYFIVRRHQLQIQVQQQAVSGKSEHDAIEEKCNKHFYILHLYDSLLLSTFYLRVNFNYFLWTMNWTLTETVVFMNSAINPFLYCWRTRELRTRVLSTIRKMLFKQTAEN